MDNCIVYDCLYPHTDAFVFIVFIQCQVMFDLCSTREPLCFHPVDNQILKSWIMSSCSLYLVVYRFFKCHLVCVCRVWLGLICMMGVCNERFLALITFVFALNLRLNSDPFPEHTAQREACFSKKRRRKLTEWNWKSIGTILFFGLMALSKLIIQSSVSSSLSRCVLKYWHNADGSCSKHETAADRSFQWWSRSHNWNIFCA